MATFSAGSLLRIGWTHFFMASGSKLIQTQECDIECEILKGRNVLFLLVCLSDSFTGLRLIHRFYEGSQKQLRLFEMLFQACVWYDREH